MQIVRNNGLTLVLLGLFAASILAHAPIAPGSRVAASGHARRRRRELLGLGLRRGSVRSLKTVVWRLPDRQYGLSAFQKGSGGVCGLGVCGGRHPELPLSAAGVSDDDLVEFHVHSSWVGLYRRRPERQRTGP